MTRDEIRKLVTEEIARPEVQAVLEDRPSEGIFERLGRALRHPLAITVLGFLLTGLLGTYIERIFSAGAEERAEMEAEITATLAREEAAQQSLIALSRLSHERAVRADLLRSAIRRDAESLVRRKKDYDVAYVAWNTELQSHFINLRKHFAANPDAITKQHRYEALIATHVATAGGAYGLADSCLTDAFDVRMEARENNRESLPEMLCSDENWHLHSFRQVRRGAYCIDQILIDGFAVARDAARHAIAKAEGKTLPDTALAPSDDLAQNCIDGPEL